MYQNPYYNPMQTYVPNQNMYKPLDQPIQQPIQNSVPLVQNTNTQRPLLGKLVDTIDVAKVTEISYDGNVNFFPLTDGSLIVTRQLMQDGTSKTTIYKPIEEEQKDLPKYITSDELKEILKEFDLSEKVDSLKDRLNDLKDEFKEFKKQKKKDD